MEDKMVVEVSAETGERITEFFRKNPTAKITIIPDSTGGFSMLSAGTGDTEPI